MELEKLVFECQILFAVCFVLITCVSCLLALNSFLSYNMSVLPSDAND